MADPKPSLAERLLAGDKRALARAISLVEDDDPEGWDLVREVYPHTGNASVVGFTGPPGAGKSTLIGALIRHQRALDREVAVLSIDPSSPFRGGALLGDRIRLSEHFLDPGVFIRSMATRGALGGLAEAALQTALLMDAAGKDDVFLETVGVGQAEVDVIDHADSVVLVLIPGSGDSIQALKAGVMEIPDIIVVNKSDHPLTDTMVREIKGVLSLGAAGGLARADHQDRGGARHRRRGAGGEAGRAPRVRGGRGHAVRAPAAEPAQRGPGPGDDAAAARAGGVAARGPRGRRAARRGGRAPDRPRQRREHDPRPRGDRDPRGRALMRLLVVVLVVAAVVAAALPIDDDRRPAAKPRAATPTATPTATPAPRRDVRRSDCPADVAGCRAVRGTVVYVERVDPDGDGDLHVVVDAGSLTLPGVTAIDVAPELRPRRDPRVGDRVSAAGPRPDRLLRPVPDPRARVPRRGRR